MDLWKMAIEGKKPQTRVLQSISRGCVVTPKEPPKRGQILDRRTTTKLEDEIDDVVDQMNQRLQIKPPPAVNDASVNVVDSIYDKYNFKRRYNENSQLPIYAERDEILSSIEKNQTVVIEGSTGCGKSTQVPQMILDDAYAKRRHCNIIVTQPRRIAAKSLAQRVSDERDWDLGTVVGYQIGLDKRYISDETAITYCTTGILLEKLLQSKSLKSYTHIILDEVHERNKDLDFLFIIIRWLLSQTGQPRTTKIVLMSATLQTERFSDYFKFYDDKWRNAPVITLRKESLYTVNCFYLEDLDIELGHVTTHWDKPGISADMYQIARSLVRKIGYLESEENEMSGCDTLGSILIFLPGIFEIGRLYNMLTEYSAKSNDVKWNCLILHSMLSMDEQRLIFQPSEEGWRKIILSTNIAESSITVPDVRYVIDFCLTKYLSTNRVNNFTSLDMDWASKSSLQQRAGRAGRVQHGRCFRMIPKKYFTTYFREFSIPELLLTPLENVVLKAKEFQVEKPHIIIGMAMDPPKMPDIATTILILKELGALLPEVRGEGYSDIDGDLTFLGKMMSSLPLDVRATRLIAIGYCFGLLEECIIMAACLTSRSIFEVSFDRNISTYNRRLEWSNGSGCDLIAMMNAYKIWHLKHNLKEFSMSGDGRRREREFCRKHHLDSRSLQECHLLKQELQERLLKLGLHEIQGVHRIRWTDSQKIIILKVVISGAFYPNVFTTDTSNNPMNEHQICHALNGRDPTRTVFFSGFPKNTTRQLYVKAIKNLFRGSVVDDTDMDNVKISFDDDSEKVFVTFDMERGCNDEIAHWESTRSSIPGRIASEVYKSVKMRQARIPMHIPLLPPMHEQHLVEECGLKLPPGREPVFKSPLEDDAQYLCMPGILADEAIGRITHIETCSKFWFQPQSEDETVASYKDELNVENPKHELFDSITLNDLKKINKADIIAAQSKHDNQFYRVSLLRWHFDNANNAYICVVRLIDTGEIQHLTLKELFKFKAMIPQSVRPPRCYQCCLAEVKPSLMNISGGNLWDRAASQFMEDFTAGKTVKTEIFSVVNAIVYVKVFVGDRCLNDELVKEKLAEVCEESYLSKTNHYKRRSAIKSAKFNVNAEEAEELNIPDEYYPIVEFEPIDMVDCRSSHKTIKLNGPKSPLEIDVYSANSENGVKNIHMDANSVNSVLLAAPEDDSMMKYVVAAHMSQKGGEDKYYALHQTTLLPNIRGFGILMAMIFSPRMHLKRDKAKTRFTSVLTGLGFVKDRPIFPQHDNVFYLDFALDEDDLNLINQIRYSIDTMLYAHDDATKKEISTIKSSLEIMKKIKEVVEKLLRKERPPMDMVVESHEWSEYEKIDVLEKTDIYKGRSIFPIQNSLKLYPMAAEAMDSLKAHCDDLYNRVDYLRGETNCRLCSVHIENITILRIHLMTRLHKEREKMIGFSRSLF